jgi:predicted ATP-dependent endonuclease of OLD family
LILLTIIDKYLRPGSIVLIDEFEVSLHPTAQRRLFHLLSEKLKRNGSQLVLATHSVEIIRLANEAEVFSLDEICGGACQ